MKRQTSARFAPPPQVLASMRVPVASTTVLAGGEESTVTLELVQRSETTRAVELEVTSSPVSGQKCVVSVELSREWALILAETLERFATLATGDEL